MATANVSDWMERFSPPAFVWYVKRLSGNDTLANGTHQAGPYLPSALVFSLFPELHKPEVKNPDKIVQLSVDSHADVREVRAIWYNNRFHGNPRSGRDETRLTGFGGKSSALLNPENTGALAVFAFGKIDDAAETSCHIWVCRNRDEEDLVEDQVGPIEPGKGLAWPPSQSGLFRRPRLQRANCWLSSAEIPDQWRVTFPSGAEIVRKSIELRSERLLAPDERLIRRRACEYEIFQSVEEAFEMPHILGGFSSIESFVARAQTILQRRKARSGRSLELHAKAIFVEESLVEGQDFAHQPESEPGKKPDFLFPSMAAYRDPAFPESRLRMLAVKTTCKDRWRQILNEADRIPNKHLLTLQEGVSETQFAEMRRAGVTLVVPKPLRRSFAKVIQPHLVSLEDFIRDARTAARG